MSQEINTPIPPEKGFFDPESEHHTERMYIQDAIERVQKGITSEKSNLTDPWCTPRNKNESSKNNKNQLRPA